MAITDINISEQLQTGAPSIRYSGTEGPTPPEQHQQAQRIAQQIWEALGPEQQSQFQSFEEFFRSGVWKQILQQMQQDEAQGPEQQGIGSLGPGNMQQQMPMPNRMGAEYGGRMVEGITEGIEKVGRGGSEIIEKIKEGIIEGGRRGIDESIWIEKLKEHLRKRRNRMGARFGGDMEELSMRETIDTPEGIETIGETEIMGTAGGGLRGEKAQEIAEMLAQERYGKEFYDLPFKLQMEVYEIALDMWDSRGD